jgi:hypothetical protein
MGESSYLGEKKQGEAFRVGIELPDTPDGLPGTKPQIKIDAQDVEVLASADMTQVIGDDTRWYYDLTVANDAAEEAHQIEYSATVGGDDVTGFQDYDVSSTSLEELAENLNVTRGLFSITINVKDDVSGDPIENVKVNIRNSANDDDPRYGTLITDSLGNTVIANLDGEPTTYTVRLAKPGGIVSKNEEIIVSASGTKNLTVTAFSITEPTDAELCRIYLYPITLDNLNITDLKITISTKEALTKVNGEYIKNSKADFNYDAGTDPHSYYFDAVQGSTIDLFSNEIGLNHTITVPAESTYDLSNLI